MYGWFATVTCIVFLFLAGMQGKTWNFLASGDAQ
jgi:hypothetical protein